ncbi:hypothetical protein [Kibdelosporangium phytohabitans]|uniref:REDY-like protein HapK n=1 Tax=Kibdelosporangium phytohabitans TaxID=860235 RepID=A0A0N9HYK1_9PSEU|nr:hypothetical protein [Kibdelosporangium phytohabitans]ALG10629.1 hypothetical protein AOZ06_30365 [Kibdelosporangium phytohabitans]MBE1461747.1 hypothetical protein [Kibdelosporangium phytohabitans]
MQKVYCLYKLKPGVTAEQYIEWSKGVDQAITRQQPCVHQFRVYRFEGRRGGEAPWDVIEDIDVDSWEAWEKCLTTPEMADVVKGFREMADRESAVTVFGSEIV